MRRNKKTRRNLEWWLATHRAAIEGDRLPVSDERGALIHRDYGSDVLFIAHLDYVGEDTVKRPRWFGKNGSKVAHDSLDNRLGCWALEALIAAGVQADLLFTDCEETGRSTVSEFVADKGRYRFALSMDRRGDDVVLYQYETSKRWRRLCGRWWPIGMGSYSCVASLQLGIVAANVGVGYEDEHTGRCWANLRTTKRQMSKVASFVPVARRKAPKAFTERIPRYCFDQHDWRDEYGDWALDEGYAAAQRAIVPVNGNGRGLVYHSYQVESAPALPAIERRRLSALARG